MWPILWNENINYHIYGVVLKRVAAEMFLLFFFSALLHCKRKSLWGTHCYLLTFGKAVDLELCVITSTGYSNSLSYEIWSYSPGRVDVMFFPKLPLSGTLLDYNLVHLFYILRAHTHTQLFILFFNALKFFSRWLDMCTSNCMKYNKSLFR